MEKCPAHRCGLLAQFEHYQTFDNIAVQIGKHYVAYRHTHLDHNAANREARTFLDDKWNSLEGKLAVVIGKEALKAVRRKFQDVWKISFTDNDLIEAMSDEEIAQEIKEIIQRLEML